jgi:hypothetical protein
MAAAEMNYRARSISRRRFLAYVGAVVAAAGAGQLISGGRSTPRAQATENFPYRLALPDVARATATTSLFFLDPEHGAGKPECAVPHAGSRACHACTACHSHAVNKLFASFVEADAGRAHIGCKCLIGEESTSDAEFRALFGMAVQRPIFDKRKDQLFS